jgi:threonine dehydrogenase-like Zn-dependent dehydrogenase
MENHTRAFWIVAPGRGEIRDEPLPEPGSDDVVVRTVFSGISRGTESLVFAGRVPGSERRRMRAPFQEGDFPAPVKYGYSCVGIVEGVWLAGRTVFVLHPHQTRFVVPAWAALDVPDDVPAHRAVLAANMETALNGVWDAEPHPGNRIAVIGAGTVGCLTAWIAARTEGCDVELIDVNPRRKAVADALGLRFAEPAHATPDADIVIHASGNPAGLASALELAGDEARIVEMSWFGDQIVPLPLGKAFHSRRLTIVSSQVGRVARPQRHRYDTISRMRLALSMLADPALDALITGESDFESLPQVMATLAASPGDTLCHRIRYPA